MIFQGQGHYGNVKGQSRSSYDEAQLHFITNVPTKYELPTPYSFRDIARTRFFKVKVITARPKVKSRSIYDKVQLHFLTNVPTKYPLPAPYSSEIWPEQDFFQGQDLRSDQCQTMMRQNYTP